MGAKGEERQVGLRSWPDILVHSVGVCPEGYIAEALRVLLSVYSSPDSAKKEIFGVCKPLTETKPESIERAFWEAEDSSGDVEEVHMKGKRLLICSFRMPLISARSTSCIWREGQAQKFEVRPMRWNWVRGPSDFDPFFSFSGTSYRIRRESSRSISLSINSCNRFI